MNEKVCASVVERILKQELVNDEWDAEYARHVAEIKRLAENDGKEWAKDVADKDTLQLLAQCGAGGVHHAIRGPDQNGPDEEPDEGASPASYEFLDIAKNRFELFLLLGHLQSCDERNFLHSFADGAYAVARQIEQHLRD